MGDDSGKDILLTPNEAAAILRVPKSWIYARSRMHAMPGERRIGRYLRIDRNELLRWISEQRGGSQFEPNTVEPETRGPIARGSAVAGNVPFHHRRRA